MINPKEQVQAITTRSVVQLSEIYVKRPDRQEKEVEVEVERASREEKSAPNGNKNEEKEDHLQSEHQVLLRPMCHQFIFLNGCRRGS